MANYEGILDLIIDEAGGDPAPSSLAVQPAFDNWLVSHRDLVSARLGSAGFTEASSTLSVAPADDFVSLLYRWQEEGDQYAAQSDLFSSKGPNVGRYTSPIE